VHSAGVVHRDLVSANNWSAHLVSHSSYRRNRAISS
jgi:hypothetical protein